MDAKQAHELEPGQEGPVAKQAGEDTPRKPGTFRPGDPRINRERGPRAKAGRGSALLRDMRRVYSQPAEKDRTEGEKNCRAWLTGDRKGFMAKLADLEKAGAAKAPARDGPEQPQPEGEPGPPAAPALVECPACGLVIDPAEQPLATDAGSAKALGVIDRLLEKKPWELDGVAPAGAGVP